MDIAPQVSLSPQRISQFLADEGEPAVAVVVVETASSTNRELEQLVTAETYQWDGPTLFATTRQRAGRGRAGRDWVTPPDTALTFSIHTWLDVPAEVATWLPLLVGSSVVDCVREYTHLSAHVKWPNDILVDTDEEPLEGWQNLRKIGGILVEHTPQGGFIIGVGLNVSQTREQLPVAQATSAYVCGAKILDADRFLARCTAHILKNIAVWEECDGDVTRAGILDKTKAVSATLGAQVRVEQPGKTPLCGVALGFDVDGGLIVRDETGQTHTIRFGDVYHLRLD
ncbi:biotin--[acetyl-CoA-carboxylase] ligase [Timonella sp. A28]|uniref:biotin--[acetyl-CoA-carboxylase] ligase n=1 Tax=Timonella sp. A28 TaxID=3442640 RepID=UPI003EB6C679